MVIFGKSPMGKPRIYLKLFFLFNRLYFNSRVGEWVDEGGLGVYGGEERA